MQSKPSGLIEMSGRRHLPGDKSSNWSKTADSMFTKRYKFLNYIRHSAFGAKKILYQARVKIYIFWGKIKETRDITRPTLKYGPGGLPKIQHFTDHGTGCSAWPILKYTGHETAKNT
jgi:hypothetical protein